MVNYLYWSAMLLKNKYAYFKILCLSECHIYSVLTADLLGFADCSNPNRSEVSSDCSVTWFIFFLIRLRMSLRISTSNFDCHLLNESDDVHSRRYRYIYQMPLQRCDFAEMWVIWPIWVGQYFCFVFSMLSKRKTGEVKRIN